MKPRSVTAIVPTHNRPEQLAACLAAIDAQEVDVPVDVIVVDDASEPPATVDPSRYRVPVQLIRTEPGGPGIARNRGLDVAEGELIWYLNDDAVPAPTCLATHLRAHAVAPEPRACLGRFDFLEACLGDRFVRLVAQSSLWFNYVRMSSGSTYPWQYLWTCNLTIHADLHRQAGPFDETLSRLAIAEDVEFGYRLQKLGVYTTFLGEAACGHDHIMPARSYFDRMWRLGRALYRMYRQHNDPEVIYATPNFSFDNATIDGLRQRVAQRHTTTQWGIEAAIDRLTRSEVPRHAERPFLEVGRRLFSALGHEQLYAGMLLESAGEHPGPAPSGSRPYDQRIRALVRSLTHAEAPGRVRLHHRISPANAPPAAQDSAPIVFVVGYAGSGVAWLGDLLGHHPQALAAGASGVGIDVLGPVLDDQRERRGRGASPRPMGPWCEILRRHDEGAGIQHYVDREALASWVAPLPDAAREHDVAAVLNLVARILGGWFTAHRDAERVVVDATPDHVFVASALLAMPGVRVIEVVRDPQSACRTADDVQHWLASVQVGAQLVGPRVRRIRYEDLVAAPATQLASLYAFAGLSPEEAERSLADHPVPHEPDPTTAERVAWIVNETAGWRSRLGYSSSANTSQGISV